MANWAADQPNETMDTDFPTSHVTWNVWTHELVPAEKLREGTRTQAEQPPVDRVWTMYTPLWQDNRPHYRSPRPQKGAKLGEKSSRNRAQVMSSAQPREMNR
jgi:hypothetical protein